MKYSAEWFLTCWRNAFLFSSIFYFLSTQFDRKNMSIGWHHFTPPTTTCRTNNSTRSFFLLAVQRRTAPSASINSTLLTSQWLHISHHRGISVFCIRSDFCDFPWQSAEHGSDETMWRHGVFWTSFGGRRCGEGKGSFFSYFLLICKNLWIKKTAIIVLLFLDGNVHVCTYRQRGELTSSFFFLFCSSSKSRVLCGGWNENCLIKNCCDTAQKNILIKHCERSSDFRCSLWPEINTIWQKYLMTTNSVTKVNPAIEVKGERRGISTTFWNWQ